MNMFFQALELASSYNYNQLSCAEKILFELFDIIVSF